MHLKEEKNKHWTKILICVIIILLCGLSLGDTNCSFSSDDDDDDHYVSVPDRPDGPDDGRVGDTITFTTEGSICYDGDDVDYRFDFGDGDISDWSSKGKATHEYDDAGTYRVSAQARCEVNKNTSSWSKSHVIEIESRGISFNSIWKDSNDTIWIAGDKGQVIKNQRDTQEKIGKENLYGIWGDSNTNLLCCGAKGSLLSYNGKKWKKYNLNIKEKLYSIDGKQGKIFIVGDKGTILAKDGNLWLQQKKITQNCLYSVWVCSENSVFVSGAKGLILYYDGYTWRKMTVDTLENIYSIWGTSYTNVWAVGSNGLILNFNGNEWKQIKHNYKANFKTVKGNSAFEIYIGGSKGTLLSIINKQIKKIDLPDSNNIKNILTSPTERNIYIVGQKKLLKKIPVE